MSSVLFIAPADLGEAVLATGALDHALRAGDALTVVCAPAAAPLFRAAPGLKELRAAAPVAALWLDLVRRPFDLVLDGGGLLGCGLLARRRVALKRARVLRHRTDEWAEALGAERALAPKIWLDDAARAAAAAAAPGGPLLVLAPGGAEEAKRWPRERFAAVARRLTTGVLANASVVVLGAGERDGVITNAVARSLDADGVAARDLGAELDLLGAAALLERATLCIGNDNVLTHMAAAVGAPTLALFGPTDERVRAPFGPRAQVLRAVGYEELASRRLLDDAAAMEHVSIDMTEAAALDLLQAGGLR
ncbi:MAG: glycosyltransferase family 9 protein [Hyphomonadaceae bacterium]|nr:glycosyltransferase family 9 protein [Hyphomonadaceae bacterium]